ncbi:minor fimbrial subunit [Buttiauxella brennerae ATCC 51605]|uniref:Minor fimbrial subunit n=1 Tax=Buttiauxella brennerae ATCC 51605 TaxID=1354251 RepID=A0A1B7INK0_9ENTR|nr:fimbrial protein [Buttiauxella brennerae]OAT31256.1 minor fimbrial subunit [Buttiauxella brennerae ATCC 51605]
MYKNSLSAALLAFALAITSTSSQADSVVDFDGTLVEDPCTLAVGDQGENIVADFGTIIDKYLYTNGRSSQQSFTILLQDCDTSLGKTVSFIFRGVEDSDQPGLLALDATSGATGVAVAITNADGTPLPLNEASELANLNDGDNQISFQAFVQASSTAITNNAITLGEFSATATFEMEYE